MFLGLRDISGVSRIEPSFAVSRHVVPVRSAGCWPNNNKDDKGDNNQPATLDNNKDDDANDK